MVIKKIYFDAFKSLINEELEIINNCTGIVGINESGKTNILNAVRLLGGVELNGSHQPKRKKGTNPKIRFDLVLDKDQISYCLKIFNDWLKTNSLITEEIKSFDFNIQYVIEFLVEEGIEVRRFDLISTKKINNDILILNEDYIDDAFKIFVEDKFIPIHEALLLNKKDLKKSTDSITKFENTLNTKKEEILKLKEESNSYEINPSESDQTKTHKTTLITQIDKKIEKLDIEINTINSIFSEFNYYSLKEKLEEEIETLKKEREVHETNITNLVKNINELKLKSNLNSSEKGVLTKYTNTLEINKKSKLNYDNDIEAKTNEFAKLTTPIEEKYSDDYSNLSLFLSRLTGDYLETQIPKVVFWNYSDEYILKSETELQELLGKTSLEEISRPLLNVFRVGLSINSIEGLKSAINTIQKDSSERGRLNDTINRNLNRYIKSIWEDYDQELRIFLEEHKIRIQFYDPNCEDASYFNMDERSQGAQTFISFLMTIGAEAEKGVIKNTVLLLDEPEIHLHPSGVRFMLKELIKIASKKNTVIFATHSIFMIDRKHFDRHVYLKKKNEQTKINPARKDRIGFFMQEEVLYNALDIDLKKDFTNSNIYNFVFEGDGDAVIFRNLYDLHGKNTPFLIKNTSFYQGGKCSDIKKYFTTNPIQLGTKWVFILDKDEPANQLKNFLEGKYKDYINKDIFIYQYINEAKTDSETELEDLMSKDFLLRTYVETSKNFDLTLDDKELADVITDEKNYIEANSDIINLLGLSGEDALNFKINFKTNLNRLIQTEIEGIKNLKEFETKYPIYFSWVSDVFDQLNKLLK